MSGDFAGGGTSARVVDALARLDAALDDLAALDLTEVPVASLGGVVREATRVQRRMDAQSLRLVAVLDSSHAFALDGGASAGAWLRANTRVSPGVAREAVRIARRLPELPLMHQALRDGEISREHVAVVTTAMARSPQRRDTIAAAEPIFVEAARSLGPLQLAMVVRRWAHTVDPLGVVEAEQAIHAQRYLSCARSFDGAVAIDGLLAPEAGALVMQALEALSTGNFRGERAQASVLPRDSVDETRTAGQRRADAFVEMSRRYLDSGAAPEVMGVRPHLVVTVSQSTLTAAPDAYGTPAAELEGVGPLSAEAARRVGCDAAVTAIRLDAVGMPLSYGRSRRVVPAALRKVLVTRDRGCRFPGCDRPAAWSQAHHIVHWGRGGSTDARNLVLLCTHHHHVVHEGGFTIRGSPQLGTLTFHRPDGSVVEDPGRAA